jgi:type VI secretion system protein ImpE
VDLVEFAPPERPLDLIWRKARLVVREAFDAEVHLPAVYGTLTGADDASRLGRRTEWIGGDGDAVVGVGRRCFALDGEEEVDMLAVERLAFGEG